MNWSLEDFVYGATDGAVTTFAVVAGVIGASLSPSIVQFSLDSQIFLPTVYLWLSEITSLQRLRLEYIEKARRREEWEIDNLSRQEKQENSRNLYEKRIQKGELLEEIVRIITSRRKVWVDTMMKKTWL